MQNAFYIQFPKISHFVAILFFLFAVKYFAFYNAIFKCILFISITINVLLCPSTKKLNYYRETFIQNIKIRARSSRTLEVMLKMPPNCRTVVLTKTSSRINKFDPNPYRKLICPFIDHHKDFDKLSLFYYIRLI